MILLILLFTFAAYGEDCDVSALQSIKDGPNVKRPCPEKVKQQKWQTYFYVNYLTTSGEKRALTTHNSIDIKQALKLYKRSAAEPRNVHETLPIETLETLFKRRGEHMGLTGEILTQEVQSARLRWQLSMSAPKTEEQMLSIIREGSQQMSFKTKVNFLSSILDSLEENYDQQRREVGSEAQLKRISFEEMTHSLYMSYMGRKHKMGVCRDIHLYATKLANAMGIEGVYGVQYATTDGYHLTTAIVNPSNRKEVITFNYGKRLEQVGSIRQDYNRLAEVAPGYWLTDKDGAPVLFLRNSMGADLHYASGGMDQDIHPLYRRENGMIETGVKRSGVDIKLVYTGETTAVGASLKAGNRNKPGVSASSGVVLFSANREGSSAYGAYIRGQIEAREQLVRNKTLTIDLFQTLSGDAATYKARSPGDDQFYQIAHGYFALDLGVDIRLKNHRTKLLSRFSLQVADAKQVRAATDIVPYHEFTSLSHRINFNTKLTCEININYFNLHPIDGFTGRVGCDSFIPRLRTTFGASVEGGTRDTPIFVYGSKRRGEVRARKDFKYLWIGSNLVLNLEELEGLEFFGISLGGKL